MTHWRWCSGLQHFVSLYTTVERASTTSPRIGNCAPIVTHGWRYPARSVPALYPLLGRMPVRVVALLCPPLRPGCRGCRYRRETEEQRHGRSAIERISTYRKLRGHRGSLYRGLSRHGWLNRLLCLSAL